MEIKTLKIYSSQLDKQARFYGELLGLTTEWISKDAFQILTQENTLILQASKVPFYYHFAFLIPPGSIHQAIQYLEERNIDLLLHQGRKIIDFGTGKAIYFYDQDQNIAEFIERPSLPYPSVNTFTPADVIKVNEIGLPVTAPIPIAEQLIQQLSIQPIDRSSFKNHFCWVGDFNGVIIVTQLGRNWLPTQLPGIINDFSIILEDQGGEQSVKFENNEWILAQF